ncbi:hypothetical protein AAKU55_000398 [Oxalobacteraceae bacterium GrIS 1.11]
MKKRQFLGAAALAGAALPCLGRTAPARGPALLTVTGAVGKVNRGPYDPVLDQMMHKQKISFDKAHAFDFEALAALPALTIKPTLQYDGKVHALRGPTLLDVLAAAGVATHEGATLLLRAVDGYAVALTLGQARAQRFIVATYIDGAPMALGGLGPLWAVYDADRVPEMAAKPLEQRFGTCPWALYHIEVQA